MTSGRVLAAIGIGAAGQVVEEGEGGVHGGLHKGVWGRRGGAGGCEDRWGRSSLAGCEGLDVSTPRAASAGPTRQVVPTGRARRGCMHRPDLGCQAR